MNIINGDNNNVFSGINNSLINIGNMNYKQQIQQLVGQGRLKEAIALYVANNGEGAILLSARFHGNERSKNGGTISTSDYNMEYNKIMNALLSYIGVDVSYQQPQSQPEMKVENHETVLLTIIEKNKRRNEKLAANAKLLLDEYVAYKQEKATNVTYDVTGRRWKDLEARTAKFLDELKETKLDDLQSIVDRIMTLVVGVPEYSDLDTAYRLAQGRGFKSEYIDRNLNNCPDDREVRITIAELLEQFASTITVK